MVGFSLFLFRRLLVLSVGVLGLVGLVVVSRPLFETHAIEPPLDPAHKQVSPTVSW